MICLYDTIANVPEILMDNVRIERATINDVFRLQEIGRLTFSETFASENTEENMNRYLDESFSVEKMSAELIDKNSEFYLALLDDNVIGYLKLNSGQSQTELKESNAIEIERIYVLKDFHGKNIGQLLYNKSVRIAREKNAEYIWLGVWEKNTRAINFYKKNGFEVFDKHIFILGSDEQTDIMMKLKLY